MFVVKSKITFKQVLASLLMLALLIPGAANATDQFGRLFTTPKQREQLDELKKGEAKVTTVDIDLDEIEVVEERDVEEAPMDAITIKGLIYRSSGRNAAWINNSNSYEGDVATQYTQISGDGITADQVQVVLPDGESRVKIKVGQTYDPAVERVKDIIPDAGSRPFAGGQSSE